MTKLDKLNLFILPFIFFFVWTAYFTKSYVGGAVCAFMLALLSYALTVHFYNRYNLTKKATAEQMLTSLSLMGVSGQTDYLFSRVPPYFNPERIENGFVFTRNREKTAVFPNIKYSPTSLDEAAKFYRSAKETGAVKCYVLSRPSPRQIAVFFASLDVDLSVLPVRTLHRYLTRQNALPPVIKPQKRKTKHSQKEVLSNVFTRDKTKYFVLSAAALAFSSLFAPFKIYYLVFCSLSLVSCVLCMTLDRR